MANSVSNVRSPAEATVAGHPRGRLLTPPDAARHPGTYRGPIRPVNESRIACGRHWRCPIHKHFQMSALTLSAAGMDDVARRVARESRGPSGPGGASNRNRRGPAPLLLSLQHRHRLAPLRGGVQVLAVPANGDRAGITEGSAVRADTLAPILADTALRPRELAQRSGHVVAGEHVHRVGVARRDVHELAVRADGDREGLAELLDVRAEVLAALVADAALRLGTLAQRARLPVASQLRHRMGAR